MRIAGIILAGGRSTRMGGADKSLAKLGGRPLLQHVLDRLRPQMAEKIALNANGDPARFSAFGLPVVADRTGDWPGPLAGILAGMHWAAAATHIATVPADTPFIPANLVARLAAAISTNAIALAASGGARHPVLGLWPVALRDDLERFLASDAKHKVTAFADRHGAVSIDFPVIALKNGRMLDPFFNINTPDDLAEAETLLAELPA